MRKRDRFAEPNGTEGNCEGGTTVIKTVCVQTVVENSKPKCCERYEKRKQQRTI